jgi:2-polyprenyl-6-methoxyphenol hydroxylase-like FAD-dependent oxidoreductase
VLSFTVDTLTLFSHTERRSGEMNNVQEGIGMVDVVIAGGGPTGLLLASELRLAGVDVLVVDKLANRASTESRAGGMHPRTMEVLDQRGMLDPFLARGRRIQATHFSGLRMDISDMPTPYPFTLALLQNHIERLLEDHLDVAVRWNSPVTAVSQDATGVDVTIGSEVVRAKYLVGCDGGRSTVRKLAGISFDGTDPTLTSQLADVELTDPPADTIFQRRSPAGDHSVFEFEEGWYRVMTTQYRVVPKDEPATVDTVRAAMLEIAGTDFGMHSPRWVSRFSDTARLAGAYRNGRILLAGDAAHIHFPSGGQGLNTGVQDAVNLGWKLAVVVHGRTPESLLDTYGAERRPVAERVVHNTRAQVAVSRPGPHVDAMRDVLAGLMVTDDVRHRLAGMITALDVHYDLGAGHPLLGRRMPDLPLKTGDGDTRVLEVLRGGRPVVLDLGAGLPDVPGVDVVRARCDLAEWDLPVLGSVPAVDGVLVRPDGYVAWTSAGPGTLAEASWTWFGIDTRG